MRTENLRDNQLSESAYTWYLSYLEAVDARDAVQYGGFLAENCTLCMNNAEPIEGRDAIVAGLAEYWKSFAGLEHDLLNVYGSDDRFALEALNHYERHDGGRVTVRAVALTDRDSTGLVTAIRVLSDLGPVFAPPQN